MGKLAGSRPGREGAAPAAGGGFAARPSFWPALALSAALVCAHLWLGFGFIRSAAPTFDETVHLAAGCTYLKTGTYRLNIMDHPPLAEMWVALPLLGKDPNLFLNHPSYAARRLYDYADHFLYRNKERAEAMLNPCRGFALVSWTLILAAALLAWAWRLAGAAGVAGAALAFAFSPALSSNLALVTTDGGAAAWFFAASWLSSLLRPGPRPAGEPGPSFPGGWRPWLPWALAGAATGLANASKFSMIVLAPIAAGTLALELFLAGRLSSSVPGRAGRPLRPAGRGDQPAVKAGPGPWAGLALGLAVFALAGLLVLAACYRFGQLGLYWDGLGATLRRMDEGRSAFFMGRHSVTGFAWYFPAALFIKTPIPVWLLAAAGLAAMSSGRFPWRERLWLLLPPLAYFGAAMGSKVQIGYRHVLPVAPFLALWAGCGFAWLWGWRPGGGPAPGPAPEASRGPASGAPAAGPGGSRAWPGKAAALGLAAWLAWSVASVRPHMLAYFNEAAGGPAKGYLSLVDSNLDWGQDLKGLAEAVKGLGNPAIYLSYFGTADPADYGIRYVPAAPISTVGRAGDDVDPSASGRVLLAVSATNLQGTYYADKRLWDWLKGKSPVRVIGYSIFLYDLSQDADGRVRLADILSRSGAASAAAALLKPAGTIRADSPPHTEPRSLRAR